MRVTPQATLTPAGTSKPRDTRANALQLTSRANTLTTPNSLRVIEKVHAITSEHIYLGDTNVKMQRPNGLHLEPGLIEGDGKIFWTVDSGATAILADLSWAKPLFCDVTVHLPSRDSQGKLAYTGSDGCYLGRDFKRNADYVYLPRRFEQFRPRFLCPGRNTCT